MALKVLITGACGFMLSNVVLYLLQYTDWKIVSVDKLTDAGSLKNIAYNRDINNRRHTFYLGDVCDYHFVKNVFEIERPNIVIHGAVDRANDFMTTNVMGARNMLEAALKVHAPQKFINISSDKVYGEVLVGKSTEQDQLNPHNPYAASKASADLLGQSYFSTYALPVITMRLSNVFGPRQHRDKLVVKAITGILTDCDIPIVGQGKQTRSWIYVKDVIHALECVIEKGTAGQAYNVSAGVEKTNLEIVQAVCDGLEDGQDLIQVARNTIGRSLRRATDSTKLEALGWKARYGFDEAIMHTIKWINSNRWSWK